MKREMIIKAWKDPQYRDSLSEEQRASLPECPSGAPMSELDEAELLGVVGGRIPKTACVHEAGCAPL